jgi:hypothetical protein
VAGWAISLVLGIPSLIPPLPHRQRLDRFANTPETDVVAPERDVGLIALPYASTYVSAIVRRSVLSDGAVENFFCFSHKNGTERFVSKKKTPFIDSRKRGSGFCVTKTEQAPRAIGLKPLRLRLN